MLLYVSGNIICLIKATGFLGATKRISRKGRGLGTVVTRNNKEIKKHRKFKECYTHIMKILNLFDCVL